MTDRIRERILIAGLGNIFLGDDAFGVEVAQRLLSRKLPKTVRVVDYGIRGLDLAYALMDGYEATILVDATSRGGAPGTIYTIEPNLENVPLAGASLPDGHGMNPMNVFALVKSMGGEFKRVLIVGCEPEPLAEEEEDGRMGLSAPVQEAVEEAVVVVESLVARLLAQDFAESNFKAGGPVTVDKTF
jgi:hydrogenase maturation protease